MNKLLLVLTSIGGCLLVTALAGSGSCRSRDASANSNMTRNDKLANGVWGGEHIRAEVSDRGATFELDCAHGAIEQAIALDSEGRFSMKGKFVPEHGGPVSRDAESTERQVEYVGGVKDKELTLTISDVAGKQSLGTFTLTHGSEGHLRKCR